MVLALVVVAAGAAAGARYVSNDAPEYIHSAEARVGSYLTSDYGRVDCNSIKINDERWELDCTHKTRGKHSSLRSIRPKKRHMACRVRFILRPSMMMPDKALSRA